MFSFMLSAMKMHFLSAASLFTLKKYARCTSLQININMKITNNLNFYTWSVGFWSS